MLECRPNYPWTDRIDSATLPVGIEGVARKQAKFTIADFNKRFPNDNACLDSLRDLIYPAGIECRACQQPRPHHRRTGRKQYACDYCGTLVAPLAGTIFEKSRTSLKSWFYAIYLMSQTRCGISAKQLERELGVTYKTAWRMLNQIRKLFGEAPEGARMRRTRTSKTPQRPNSSGPC